MLRVEVPKDKKKLLQQIKALRHQISIDDSEMDKGIHMEALRILEEEFGGAKDE